LIGKDNELAKAPAALAEMEARFTELTHELEQLLGKAPAATA
jgi:hypothetical protein